MKNKILVTLFTPNKRSLIAEDCIAAIANALREITPHGSWSADEHAAHERLTYDMSNPPEAMADLFPRLNAGLIAEHDLEPVVAYVYLIANR
jgi:hypothetical protein